MNRSWTFAGQVRDRCQKAAPWLLNWAANSGENTPIGWHRLIVSCTAWRNADNNATQRKALEHASAAGCTWPVHNCPRSQAYGPDPGPTMRTLTVSADSAPANGQCRQMLPSKSNLHRSEEAPDLAAAPRTAPCVINNAAADAPDRHAALLPLAPWPCRQMLS